MIGVWRFSRKLGSRPPRPGPRIASKAGLRTRPSSQRRERHLWRRLRNGRTWLPVASGLGCLGAVLVLGLAVEHGATPVDEAAYRDLRSYLLAAGIALLAAPMRTTAPAPTPGPAGATVTQRRA